MNIVLCLHKYGVPLDDPCPYPLGFMYVSSILKSHGHKVKVLNYNLWDYDFVEEVKGADQLLFTGFEEFTESNQRFSATAREMGITTVLGGAMATFEADSQRPFFDIVVQGEIEDYMGFDFRKSPYPDYEGFGINEYHRRNGMKHIGILTSRGCPHKCTFCAHTCKFRVRSLADVETEVDYYIHSYKPAFLVFNDNTLNITTRRFKEVCRMMSCKNTQWSAAIRVDNFDEECAILAKKSGCHSFVVGVESFNQAKLDRMKKGVTTQKIYQTLDLLEKYKLGYHGNILFGLAGDTADSISAEVMDTRWEDYSIMPAIFREFTGVSEKSSCKIDARTEKVFKDYIYSKGMYLYPT